MAFQTEYEFELPRGYIDKEGNLHKNGTIRLSTAIDEIMPLKDSRVIENPAYITIIILSRVIIKLGTLTAISNNIIEDLFAVDLNYLQDLYQRINATEYPCYSTSCPHCNKEIKVPINFFQQEQ